AGRPVALPGPRTPVAGCAGRGWGWRPGVRRRTSRLGCVTALRGADRTPRPGGAEPAHELTPSWVVTRACQDVAAGEGVQLGGGQVDQPGRVLGQQGPLGGAEAVAEGLVLPRADDLLDGHHSLLSRAREGRWRSHVPIPPVVVAPD